MASNDTNCIAPGAKQGPNAQDLDKIANCMDDMLKNMKQHVTKSRWNELCNSTFNSLDVTRSAVKNSYKQVLETIHEDQIFNPVPSAGTSMQTVRKVSTDVASVAFITEIPLSEASVNNSPKTSVKSNKQQTKQQSIKISKEKGKKSPPPSNKSSKNNSASVKKDTQPITVVNDLTRPRTQPSNSQRKSVGIKQPISQNSSRTAPASNKTIETIMAPIKINELNSIKKNKPNSSLRHALSKIKLQMENKNKDGQKTKSNITQPNSRTIPASQSTKPALKAQSMDSKQVTYNKVPNSKQIKNVKNVIVKQIQNGKIPVKPQNIGDKIATTKLTTNNPTSVNTKPQITNKAMDNTKTKENINKSMTVQNNSLANTSNDTNRTERKNVEPVVQTILVSNQTQNRPSVDCKLVIKPSDLTLPSLYQNTAINNLIMEYMTAVNQAKRERKTYTIVGGFQPLRQALAQRGWIEKVRVLVSGDRENWKKMESLSNLELAEGILTDKGPKYRRALLSKLLLGHQVDFYWDYATNPFIVNNDKVKRTLINRFPFGATRCYCSKAGLCNSLRDSKWYHIEGYANILAPRTYNLEHDTNIQEFIHDFRLTAAISLMKWIDEHAMDPSKIVSENGTIPMSVYNFAVLQIANFIREREHRDIDEPIESAPGSEWDLFLEKYYEIIQEDKRFIESGKLKPPYMIKQARYLLHELRRYLPDMMLDGMMNLWLMKPHHGSRGCGILVCRTLKYILDTVQARKDRKYVVQKYIERPLLIYNTKFDIRQWFLVTCMPYLKVWMYKECYLRFSSQMFDLKKLNESIHLTNNSVQCKYKNCERDAKLPAENMWHSATFEQYLHDMGYPFVWKNIIYRGMKEALVALYMTCQDKMATRINSFELCGADFMVSEDFKPYLIEINSRPAIYGSTKITAAMCPKVLIDVIKVTIDHARNPKASTGNFELIYSDSLSYAVPRTIQDIDTFRVEGKSYPAQVTNENTESTNNLTNNVLDGAQRKSDMIEQILNIDATKVKKDAKGTLEKILEIIHSEQTKTNEKRNRTIKVRNMLSEFVDIIANNEEEKDESSLDHHKF